MKLRQKTMIRLVRIKFRWLRLLSPKRAAKEAVRLFCTPRKSSGHALPAMFQEAEELTFTLDQHRVQGYRFNHPAEQRAVILHGFDSSAVNFNGYIQPLIDKGYEVIAFDAPAHGRSEGELITVMVYSDLIFQITEQFGPVHAYIAHSMGGLALGLAMELNPPDPLTRIVLIAPVTESDSAFKNFFSLIGIRNNKVRKHFNQLIVELTGRPLTWFSLTRVMQKLKARVLWIHDEDDQVTPLADTNNIRAQNYASVKFVITNGLGHRRIYRDENVVKSVIDFL